MTVHLGNDEELTKEELFILYKFIEHMHIPYDNVPLIETVRKLARIVNDNRIN